jgi:NAD(P)-dependent dehydrogenase (short-subunit alcohol dehydrogenase family)
MPTVLITGASRGIGLEFVRQYAADGWRVLACCRKPAQAEELRSIDGDVERHTLDVTDGMAVRGLAGEYDLPIDVVINNAGIYGPKGAVAGEIDDADWDRVMRTNVYAPVKVAAAFKPHLARSDRKLLVNISSRMGSIGDNTSGGNYPYRSSKAALNQVMKSLALEWQPDGIAVLLLHPGWVQTDMGGESAAVTPEQSVSGLRRIIDAAGIRDTARFVSYDGSDIPW